VRIVLDLQVSVGLFKLKGSFSNRDRKI
jgi:hypothetical protein